MQDFSGRTAVITGGASGIGLGMARSFAARENRKDGRTASWASLRSGLGGRRGRTFLFTCTRARFGRAGATWNASVKKTTSARGLT